MTANFRWLVLLELLFGWNQPAEAGGHKSYLEKMKKHLFLLLLLPTLLIGQDRPELSALLIPSELRDGANAVIRNQQVTFDVKSPGQAAYREVRTVTLFNYSSSYDVLVVHYNTYNKLGKIKGRVYDANGNLVRQVHKKEVRDVSAISGFSIYEDDRIRYVDIDHPEYPYTVEFEYEKTYKDLLYYPGWEVPEFAVGVEKVELNYNLPEGVELYHQGLNIGTEPVISSNGNRTAYRWQIEHLPPAKHEKFGPPNSELLPSVKLSPSKFEAEKYEGSMASWKDFGLFMNRLLEGRDQLSPAMQQTVAQLTAHAKSDKEKIDILYRYMQENMRYVSVQMGTVGGWQPFSASYVESNKYGDCKALSNFMMAMLKEVGITSYPVLIYSGDLEYEIQEDFAVPAFNHMILHVPSENYWLECTSTTAPPNYLGAGTDNRNVLLITEEGGRVERTPELTPGQNVEQNEVAVSLESTGGATVEMTSVRTGDRQEFYRYAAKNMSREELGKTFQENISLPSFSLEKLEVQTDPSKPKTTVTCRARVQHYASKAGKRLFVPMNPMNAYSNTPPKVEERLHPIVQNRGYTESDRITVQIPEGYTVESLPSETMSLKSDCLNFMLNVSQSEGKVTIERRLEILPCRLPAEEYGAWRELHQQVARADAAKLVLVRRT